MCYFAFWNWKWGFNSVWSQFLCSRRPPTHVYGMEVCLEGCVQEDILNRFTWFSSEFCGLRWSKFVHYYGKSGAASMGLPVRRTHAARTPLRRFGLSLPKVSTAHRPKTCRPPRILLHYCAPQPWLEAKYCVKTKNTLAFPELTRFDARKTVRTDAIHS